MKVRAVPLSTREENQIRSDFGLRARTRPGLVCPRGGGKGKRPPGWGRPRKSSELGFAPVLPMLAPLLTNPVGLAVAAGITFAGIQILLPRGSGFLSKLSAAAPKAGGSAVCFVGARMMQPGAGRNVAYLAGGFLALSAVMDLLESGVASGESSVIAGDPYETPQPGEFLDVIGRILEPAQGQTIERGLFGATWPCKILLTNQNAEAVSIQAYIEGKEWGYATVFSPTVGEAKPFRSEVAQVKLSPRSSQAFTFAVPIQTSPWTFQTVSVTAALLLSAGAGGVPRPVSTVSFDLVVV